ncbi:hypothetical protein AYO21_04585 [Fonsecaea monophora]|uniref:FAD dependent oxidoreductase domain-containing protein n=1 Tax=Fonsecaea monophora TaxID=254056 RepID=A0A177FAH8_9EURO|nr:hypothetical protein AYO21_04585 [Fonsecaea monophora]KAH0837124.1 FAD dependent oxidoreductase superfamily [Fonsecaea pedrosoi]OAG41205.1 hypothetical protein AYO21_04585 [Fonsecaea monophora]
MSTVILGGGIIGLSTAYYLSLAARASSPTRTIHIVDSSPALLASASGFAGGFLAADWFSPSVAALGALSFRLHRELAETHDGPRRWGYARSHTYNLSVDDSAAATRKGRRGDWLRDGTSRVEEASTSVVAGSQEKGGGDDAGGGGRGEDETLNPDGSPAVWTPQPSGTLETISGPESCAQIEPRELCEFLLDECQKRGVQVHLSTCATGILTDDDDGALRGLVLASTNPDGNTETRDLECRDVLISAGAWTPRVFETLFPQSTLQIPIEPLAGHSLVVKSPRYKRPFVDIAKRKVGGGTDNWLCYSIYSTAGVHWSFAPEAFARLARNGDTEIWVGGLNDSALPLPELASDVKALVDPESIRSLRKTTVQLTGRVAKGAEEGNDDDLETVRQSLCFRPVSQRGTPLLGKIPEHYLGLPPSGSGGVWIASGHGPWGISLSLGTGLVMSELISGETPSADIKSLLVA